MGTCEFSVASPGQWDTRQTGRARSRGVSPSLPDTRAGVRWPSVGTNKQSHPPSSEHSLVNNVILRELLELQMHKNWSNYAKSTGDTFETRLTLTKLWISKKAEYNGDKKWDWSRDSSYFYFSTFSHSMVSQTKEMRSYESKYPCLASLLRCFQAMFCVWWLQSSRKKAGKERRRRLVLALLLFRPKNIWITKWLVTHHYCTNDPGFNDVN